MARDLEGPEGKQTSSVPSSQFLILSLFLLLLAFFIALTSGAEFDDNKTDPVIDSLAKVFPVSKLRGEGLPAYVAQENEARGAGEAQADFDRVDAVFSSDSFPFQKRLSREFGAFVVTMDPAELEELLSIKPARVTTPMQKQRFFATLSTFLSTNNNRRGHDLNIILSTTEHPSRLSVTDPAALNSLIRQSESYAVAFKKNGISSDKIIAGLQRGADSKVRLIFTPIYQTGGGFE